MRRIYEVAIASAGVLACQVAIVAGLVGYVSWAQSTGVLSEISQTTAGSP